MNLSVDVDTVNNEPVIKITLSGWLVDDYVLETEWITKEMLEQVLNGVK